MKVTIVSPCDLPVPATKGGAVATLIESIVKQNELNKKMELTVISSYDNEAKIKSQEYKNTKFVFIKEPKICKIIDETYEFIYKLITRREHKILKRYAWKLYIIFMLKHYFNNNSTDKIVLENSGYLLNILKSKKICQKYNSNIYYHLHNDVPDNIYVEGLKQCKLLLISEYLEKKIIKICGESIKQNFLVLKNGFDCSLFNRKISKIEKNEIKENIGIDKNKKIIIYAGRITQEKGIEELTNAFINLDREDLTLLVVGSHNFGGKNTTSFEKKMKEKFSKLGSRIKFTGFIPYSDIWKYYKVADLAVLPSIWQEPAGLTMLEATAASIPLITTRTGGIPEYLSDKQVMMLDVNENIEETIKNTIYNYLNNEKKYQKIAAQTSKYVNEEYNENKYYFNFLDRILK